MVLDPHTEPLGQVVDRALERRIVERDELPALVADEMVVVLAVGLRALEPGLAVADGHALDEAVVNQ